jgi:pyruvate dehydrogenase E1 component
MTTTEMSPRSCVISAATTSRTCWVRCGGPARRPTVLRSSSRTRSRATASRWRAAAEPLRLARRDPDRPTADSMGLTVETEWDGYAAETPEGVLLAEASERLDVATRPRCVVSVPANVVESDPGTTSTQAAFGRTLLDLVARRGVDERSSRWRRMSRRRPTSAASSTRQAVWGPDDEPVYDAMEDSPLKWRVGPTGQHIEMGIAEMNLVLLLGQLGPHLGLPSGSGCSRSAALRPLRDAGARGMSTRPTRDPASSSPARRQGISLSPRRRRAPVALDARDRDRDARAHLRRSPASPASSSGCSSTRSRGCRRQRARRSTSASRRHRSTRPRSQPQSSGSAEGAAPGGRRRRRVPAPRSRSRRRPRAPRRLRRDRSPGARGARAPLDEEGVEATVSASPHPDRLYRDWQGVSHGSSAGWPGHTVPPRAPAHPPTSEGLPVVTVIDGSSHALAFRRQRTRRPLRHPRRRTASARTGSQPEVYAEYGIDAPSIATAALVALEPGV